MSKSPFFSKKKLHVEGGEADDDDEPLAMKRASNDPERRGGRKKTYLEKVLFDGNTEQKEQILVDPSRVFHSGWLYKKRLKSPKKRFCVLFDSFLVFYKNSFDIETIQYEEYVDYVDLTNLVDVALVKGVTETIDEKSHYEIDLLVDVSRVIQLYCEDLEATTSWINKIAEFVTVEEKVKPIDIPKLSTASTSSTGNSKTAGGNEADIKKAHLSDKKNSADAALSPISSEDSYPQVSVTAEIVSIGPPTSSGSNNNSTPNQKIKRGITDNLNNDVNSSPVASSSPIPGKEGLKAFATKAKAISSKLKVTNLIRGLVSKKKKRFVEEGYNLDLSYITDNIIAMGIPSEGKDALFRNPMSEVMDFFNSKHSGHYKIYNLCAEKNYDPDKFNACVELFPMFDHHPPPLSLMRPFCISVDKWLSQDPENVAVIHCKAGKGRTGCLTAAYLIHSKICKTASEAIQLFGEKRTSDGKGITIPSQIRYVYYYEKCLLENKFPIGINDYSPMYLKKITWSTIPTINPTVNFQVFVGDREEAVYEWEKKHQVKKYTDLILYSRDQISASFDMEDDNVLVKGDICVKFFDGDKKMFHFFVNTRMIENDKVTLKKKELDGGCKKDKKCLIYQQNFTVDLYFGKVGLHHLT